MQRPLYVAVCLWVMVARFEDPARSGLALAHPLQFLRSTITSLPCTRSIAPLFMQIIRGHGRIDNDVMAPASTGPGNVARCYFSVHPLATMHPL